MLVQIFWQYIWTHVVLTDASNSNTRSLYSTTMWLWTSSN